jgi:predicted NUDIX family NTP pyrophosphohydrolase
MAIDVAKTAGGVESSSMARQSAGIVVYRRQGEAVQVLLVHPGGPFWRNRDLGAWSIPKGEYSEGEDPEAAARREFAEETGWSLQGELRPLGEIRQKGGKLVTAFAVEGDFDAGSLKSNVFEMEWPPKSGRTASFPEVDRAGWFALAEARDKIVEGQRELLDRLETLTKGER